MRSTIPPWIAFIPSTIRWGVVSSVVIARQPHTVASQVGFFGRQVNIDAALVRSTAGGDSRSMVQLENGCTCCSAGDDLLGALEHLLKTNPGLQHIVVEVPGPTRPLARR